MIFRASIMLLVLVFKCKSVNKMPIQSESQDSLGTYPLGLPIKGRPYIDPYFGGEEVVQSGQTAEIGCRVYSVYNRWDKDLLWYKIENIWRRHFK